MATDPRKLEHACRLLQAARHIVVFTGAGVSAESGIPTFRDESGFWRRFPPEEFANWSGLLKIAVGRPRNLIDFILAVLEPVAAAVPNAAHHAIAAMERYRKVTVITQNVDGLHQEAGSSSVREIHGCLLKVANSHGQAVRTLSRDDLRHVVEQLHQARDRRLPLLRLAGALKGLVRFVPPIERPRVVIFGEGMAEPDWTFAREDVTRCDVMLVVGTSGLVYPAASLPTRARQAGATIIVVDPTPPDFPDYWLQGKAAEVIPLLVPRGFEQ